MKNHAIFLVFTLLTVGCKRHVTRESLETNLKDAWYHFLTRDKHYDSSSVKFRVNDVVFYEDHTAYLCRFTVRMQMNGHDTTGQMFGTISKDFNTIKRKW